ncbi:YceI-like domain-containing protein [Geodermatophilus ruber]|uniref:YceI-like domain-containing protein n=2 Tax=Geodermatophilus ruber TaxID=504800 RepID=A0A1I4A6H1_9ACTN|nr:YceI-like domain-containing protein [Geodermatophilus ruber]
MLTKVRGSFNELGGTSTIDGDDPAGSSVRVTIDVAGIGTRKARRHAHWRSNALVAMDEFPRREALTGDARAPAAAGALDCRRGPRC